MKILIAEDFEDTRMVLTMALQSRHYKVTCAENGVEALKLAKTLKPDLIISDIMMPEMDGFDLCRHIKQDDTLHRIPFIFYTATFIEEEDRKLAMAAGASRFIIKPIGMDQFLPMVDEVLSEYAKHRLPDPESPLVSDSKMELMHERSLTKKLDKKVWQLERERRALKVSELKYRTLFASSADAIMMLDNGVFSQCNSATIEIFACASEDDFLGKRPDDFSPDIQPGGQSSRQLAEQYIGKSLEQGSHHFEWLHKRLDGTEFLADVKLSAMDLDGKITVQALVRDISERKRKEAELRKLSACIEQSGEAILITDKHGNIEYVNSSFSKLTGYSPKEALYNSLAMLNSGSQDAAFYENLWSSVLKGETWQGKVIDKRKDGSFYPALLTISPIHEESSNNDSFTHFVVIQSDLTHLEDAEARFQQAQKMEAVGTLVGGIAHDFNNMLAGITGNLYLAKKRVQAQPEVVAKLDNIEQLSLRAAEMIQQLLTFSRKGIVDIKPLSLTPFIKETLKFLSTSVPENIILHQDVCNDDLLIKGDVTQLHQVLMNLINNARDAVENSPQPAITIALQACEVDAAMVSNKADVEAGLYARLSVSDNGEGIANDQMDALFDPFFTTKPVGKGTGLGLAMVYGAVKTHHGYIDVESTQGSGSTFHIYIPLELDQAKVCHMQEKQDAIRGSGELVLLVDDESIVRKAISAVLESFGYRVLQAEDGLQGLDVFKMHQHEVDIALLDLVMPVCGGVPLAKRMRELNPDLPVIFMTGYDKDHLLEKGEQLAHDLMLSKPVNFDALSHSIRQLLD